MSTEAALLIHSESMPSERWPILKPAFQCPGDRSEDASGIAGTSPVFQSALQEARLVAPKDSPVVISGEKGAGQQLFADLIHGLSWRRGDPFIGLNFAAIAQGLLESDLFAHEKGAFPSAIAQRMGRFEAANHGTLFPDEIGGVPPSRSKLLPNRHAGTLERARLAYCLAVRQIVSVGVASRARQKPLKLAISRVARNSSEREGVRKCRHKQPG
jgi:transcriptional regulator with GAF, ATPase, and Fis domain